MFKRFLMIVKLIIKKSKMILQQRARLVFKGFHSLCLIINMLFQELSQLKFSKMSLNKLQLNHKMKYIFIGGDRKSTRLNSSHVSISYAVFCLKKKKNEENSEKETVVWLSASYSLLLAIIDLMG